MITVGWEMPFSHMVSSEMNLSASDNIQTLFNPKIWRRHWGLSWQDSNPQASKVVLLQRKQTQFWDFSAGLSRVGCSCTQFEGDDDGYCIRLWEHTGGCSHKVSQRDARPELQEQRVWRGAGEGRLTE